MKNKVINIWDKYHHFLWSVIYMIVYLLWFALIETRKFSRYTVIHTALDDKIPFIEIFVIPYIIWFFYVAWIVLYTGFTDRYDYYRVCAFLFTGMTIFLLISTLWPNIHYLRPRIMPRDNIFCDMVSMIYRMDTPTNLWPSIHVYNSIGVYFAVMHSERLGTKKWIKNTCLGISISIILSTMFIKQHSTFDIMTAFVMAAVLYVLVYRTDIILNIRTRNLEKKKRKQHSYNWVK